MQTAGVGNVFHDLAAFPVLRLRIGLQRMTTTGASQLVRKQLMGWCLIAYGDQLSLCV